MARWTQADLDRVLARSAAHRAGLGAVVARVQDPKPEHPPCHEPVGEKGGQGQGSGRAFVSIESRRVRLIDPRANLYGGSKAIEDGLVYAGILRDDSQGHSEGHVFQTKVRDKEEEGTLIRVWFR